MGLPAIKTGDPGPPLTDGEFSHARRLAFECQGLDLADNQRALIVGRLAPLLSRYGYATYEEYLCAVERDNNGRLKSEFVDRLTTNHTYFWREADGLTAFGDKLLPEAIDRRRKAGQKTLHVWCAASSTGEEPYTLAMLLLESLGVAASTWDTGILATDISARVLDIAREARYQQKAVERLPDRLRRSGFRDLPGGQLEVSAHIRNEVTFRRINLLNPSYPFKKGFDIIFCRNVMIYFDAETRRRVCAQMISKVLPGGHLVVGAAESVPSGLGVEQVAPNIYRKPK